MSFAGHVSQKAVDAGRLAGQNHRVIPNCVLRGNLAVGRAQRRPAIHDCSTACVFRSQRGVKYCFAAVGNVNETAQQHTTAVVHNWLQFCNSCAAPAHAVANAMMRRT